jgi:hypothetical protein
MAYDGELVKMGNGRWARFQQCTVCNAGHQDSDSMTLLVAVELAEHFQDLLDAAEDSLARYRAKGIPVHVRIDPNGKGTLSLELDAASASVH